jgi:hypothetical protein
MQFCACRIPSRPGETLSIETNKGSAIKGLAGNGLKSLALQVLADCGS